MPLSRLRSSIQVVLIVNHSECGVAVLIAQKELELRFYGIGDEIHQSVILFLACFLHEKQSWLAGVTILFMTASNSRLKFSVACSLIDSNTLYSSVVFEFNLGDTSIYSLMCLAVAYKAGKDNTLLFLHIHSW